MSYPRIIDFGCIQTNKNNAVAESLLYNQDMMFGIGPGPVQNFGPAGNNSQAYMAERCAGNWDEYCEIYYQENNVDGQRFYPNTFKSNSGQCSGTLGDSLLKNAGELRFLRFNNTGMYKEPLNPLIADSPMITRFLGRRTLCDSTLTARVNNRTIDSDLLMARMLQKPNVNGNTLRQIYNLTQINKQDLMKRNGLGDPSKNLDNTNTGAALQSMFGVQQAVQSRTLDVQAPIFTNYGVSTMPY